MRTPAGRDTIVRLLLFGLPVAYLAALFVGPLLNLARMSLADPTVSRTTASGWTLDNYRAALADPVMQEAVLATFRIGFWVAFLALLVGYPLALFLTRTTSRWRSLLLAIILAPIFISIVVRTYGWTVLLSNRGLVNSALVGLGITDAPLRLMFNEVGIIIGTTHVLLPFMILSVMGSLQVMDRSLEAAAMSLGARPWRVFRDVVWPLSLPGVAAGLLLVFVLAISSFVTPMLLGGQVVMTLPIVALQQFTTVFNWVAGSTVIMILVVAVIAVTLVYDRLLRGMMRRGAPA